MMSDITKRLNDLRHAAGGVDAYDPEAVRDLLIETIDALIEVHAAAPDRPIDPKNDGRIREAR
jgi:hypothetical protein